MIGFFSWLRSGETQKSSRVGRLSFELLESRDVPALIGALDPSFGTAGNTITNFGGSARSSALAIQPDGKILAAGTAVVSGLSEIAIARYNPDGSLDDSFGTLGQELIGDGGTDVGTSIAIQADGKILVAGSTTAIATNSDPTSFLIYRLNSNGTLDPTFGTNDHVVVDFGVGSKATGLAIQSSGQIVVAGLTSFSGGGDFAVAALKTNGALDTSFNGSGVATIDFGGIDGANAIALESNGNIVLAGFTGPSSGVTTSAIDFAIARLTSTGALDTSFNATGKETIDFGFNDTATAVAIQSDGNIVVAGTAAGSSPDFAVARVLSSGGLDPTFNGTGKVDYNFGADDEASGVAIQPDGKIIVVGTTTRGVAAGAGATGVLLRLTPSGLLDSSFSSTGTSTFGSGTQVTAGEVALTPTGRIIVVGGAQTSTTAGTSSFVVSRLIGTVEEGRELAVGGSLNGTATIYSPVAGTLGYNPTPSGSIDPFVGLNVNVRTAVGDINGDGYQDTVLVTGPGTAIEVAVVSGKDGSVLVQPFDPFGGGFTGGGFVAVGDFDNSGHEDIIVTPDQGGGPRVAIFQLTTTGLVEVANFYGINDPAFRGGVRAAAGDINGDGVADLVVAAGFGGGPRVAIYDGKSITSGMPTELVSDFFAFSSVLQNGVYVAVGDVNGDGFGDIILGAGPGGGPRVLILSGEALITQGSAAAIADPISNFFVAGSDSNRGGVRVAAKDIDGDNKADVVVGSGYGQPSFFRVYAGLSFTSTSEPGNYQDLDPYGLTLADGVYPG